MWLTPDQILWSKSLPLGARFAQARPATVVATVAANVAAVRLVSHTAPVVVLFSKSAPQENHPDSVFGMTSSVHQELSVRSDTANF